MHVERIPFAVPHDDMRARERPFLAPERLDFKSAQFHTRLKCFKDFVVKTRLLILNKSRHTFIILYLRLLARILFALFDSALYTVPCSHVGKISSQPQGNAPRRPEYQRRTAARAAAAL